MNDAFICDALRTPIGRYCGGLATVRADDLASIPVRALITRLSALDPAAIDDVILGCANQAGEDNRTSQCLAVLRELGLADDDARVNPNGGAITLGHPLGTSGARLATTVTEELQRSGGQYGLAAMCVGVGQGIAPLIERT